MEEILKKLKKALMKESNDNEKQTVANIKYNISMHFCDYNIKFFAYMSKYLYDIIIL